MNKTKVGIITFHNTTNFGSYLQTLGLYQAIVNLGFDCSVIDYRCRAIEAAELPSSAPKELSVREIVKFILFEPAKRKKYRAFRAAIKEKIRLTRAYTADTIKEANEDIDVFVTGSDILWDLDLTDNDMAFFLDFTDDNKKRIAYSTSIGEKWTPEKYERLKYLLKRYNHIALREESSAEWLGKLLEKKIDSVYDPTMLMNPDYWNDIIDKTNCTSTNKKDYILVYFPNDKIIHDAREYASENDLDIVVINYGLKIKEVKNISPHRVEEFLLLIRNAKLVLTSSYHGTLFAIYFNVPFYSYMRNNAHNVRFESLLAKLHFEDRLRNNDSEGGLSTDIDFQLLQNEVEEWRTESIKKLKEYLE